jgi:hypothetical protein
MMARLPSLPRRFQFVLGLSLFFLFGLFFLGTSNTNDFDPLLDKVPKIGSQIQAGVHHAVEAAQNVVDHVPILLGPSAHTPPPEQANSSSGEAKWYTDWKWRNPFSDSVTFDEDRAVLPPVRPRPPIYTYYDPGGRRKDEKSKKAEQDILIAWRRAWWAQGFKPVILTSAESTHNPLYKTMQGLSLQPEMQQELMRWLAWSNMGSGILASWLAFPMSRYDDSLLTFLRRGEYPELAQYEDLGTALYVGSKDRVDSAIQEALASRAIGSVKSMYEAVSHQNLKLEPGTGSIAYYSADTIKSKYVPIRKLLDTPSTVGDALAMLPALINSHLHSNWQNSFPKGIAVLKPMPDKASVLIESAMSIATNLTHCPFSPIPASCPPNRARCEHCISNHFAITTPSGYRNDSKIFTIGTLPHPYTIATLVKSKSDMNVSFIRRETSRDLWIRALTQDILGKSGSSFARLPTLKDAVASDDGNARSIWLTAERPFQKDSSRVLEDLDWVLGFEIRRKEAEKGESGVSAPGRPPPPRKGHEFGDGDKLDEKDVAAQRSLLESARTKFALLRQKKNVDETAKEDFGRIRRAAEGWNLADTEAWKFVRAFNARQRIERKRWEDEEEAFLGKGFYDRWMDKIL